MQRILTKREKIILYVTAGVVIFSIIFNFLISPLLQKTQSLNKEINVTGLKLRKYIQLLSNKDNIQNRYNEFVAGKNSTYENKDPLVAALSVLEGMAKDAGVRIIDIRPQASQRLDLYKEILIDLRTEASMESYIKFLYNIESSLSLLKIKKFQLNTKPNSQFLEGNFSISRISLPE
jgi:hypothetical protein